MIPAARLILEKLQSHLILFLFALMEKDYCKTGLLCSKNNIKLDG